MGIRNRGSSIGSDATRPGRGSTASTHEHIFDLLLTGLILSRVAVPLFSAPGHMQYAIPCHRLVRADFGH